jgi:hypothetical protein
MTPQERQMIDDLFDRLARVESATRDPAAEAAIAQAWQRAPNAAYALVQTVLVQDEALKRAHERIEALEARGDPEQKPAGGFLDSMRDNLFGQGRGSVPNVPPPSNASGRPAWNTGQVLGQGGGPDSYPPQQQPQAAGGGGGSFLGTAAAAAAGVVGGSLLLNSIRSMIGGGQHGFGDASALGNKGSSGGPWSSDQSGGNLARDAGVNDIGSSGRGDGSNRAGQFDQAQADADQDQDQDQDDEDDFAENDDGYDGDDDSDFA